MSIASEVNRINSAKADSFAAVKKKGGTVPPGSKIADLSEAIKSIPASRINLKSLTIVAPPSKTNYLPNQAFEPYGMTVQAEYSNGAAKTVTDYTVDPTGGLPEGIDGVTVIYTEYGVTVTAKTPVTVSRATIQLPTQTGSLIYSGSVQQPVWSGYDPGKMAIGGVVDGTDAGVYVATFTPTDQYKWPDGSTGAKDVTWRIERAPGRVTLSPASVVLNLSSPSAKVRVSRLGNGVISASPYWGGVSASVSGDVVTVSTVGEQTGDGSVGVSAAQSKNYTVATATLAVKAEFRPPVLADASWEQIRKASDNGQGANYWKVGDTKAIALNGNVGNKNFANTTLDVFIIGFDHNAAREGNNRIHFLAGKKNGKMVGLLSNKYSPDVSFTPGGTGDYMMKIGGTNSGGWNASYMRKTILGADRNPNSPGANTMLSALPSDLRVRMKPVTKYTNNTGKNDTAGAVTATTDYLFLLAEYEVHGGNRTHANQYEKNSQVQYAFFADGNSKVANKYNATGTAVIWWLRSPRYDFDNSFCSVSTDGSARVTRADASLALLAGFAV